MTPDGVGGVLRPNHMAIIMDGNGRWAARSGKGRHLGHRAGVKAARTVVEAVAEAKVKILTLFAFSSENFNRPPAEVDALMRLFIEVLQREVDALHRNGIQVRFIGNREALPNLLRKRMVDAEARTASNSRMTLVLALAYGGQWDMVQAMRRIGQKVRAGELEPTEIDEGTLNRHRALAGLPPPDMLIRTGVSTGSVISCSGIWPTPSSASAIPYGQILVLRMSPSPCRSLVSASGVLGIPISS